MKRENDNNIKSYHKYRYYNIYKNMLRDLKIHFKQKFDSLAEQFMQQTEKAHCFKYSFKVKKSTFQFNLLYFARNLVDPEILAAFFGEENWKDTHYLSAYRGFAFTLGSVIYPKVLTNTFQEVMLDDYQMQKVYLIQKNL